MVDTEEEEAAEIPDVASSYVVSACGSLMGLLLSALGLDEGLGT